MPAQQRDRINIAERVGAELVEQKIPNQDVWASASGTTWIPHVLGMAAPPRGGPQVVGDRPRREDWEDH